MKRALRRCFCGALVLGLLAGIVSGALQSRTDDWRDKLIRLHVVANSDREEDQQAKLIVRDAVLEAAEPMLQNAADVDEAAARLSEGMEAIRTAAQNAAGDATVQVSLTREAFPLRKYDTFTLPAGTYTALRVTIGAGEGHNWWCVVYPSLCFAASAEELTDLAVSAGLSEQQAARLVRQRDGYVFRFQLLDWWNRIVEWLRSR